MDFLQSFSLRDLLIFSPESYFTLFELSNKALWPLQILLILSALLAVLLIYKRHHLATKLIFIWLGLVWAFVGYSYFRQYYSQISTYAHYLSYLFWIEAGLLFLFAFVTKHELINTLKVPFAKERSIIGYGLILYGIFMHPVISLFIWKQTIIRLELFAIAPDPTAIATIGFILLLPVRTYSVLIIIPCLWLLLSVITYLAF